MPSKRGSISWMGAQMAATERDDERWQMALEGMREASQNYQRLTTMVQNGLGSLSTIVDGVRIEQKRSNEDIRGLRDDIKRLQETEGDCQEKLGALTIEVAKVKADGRARIFLMKAVIVVVVLLFIASLTQTGLWWYVVTRLFNV